MNPARLKERGSDERLKLYPCHGPLRSLTLLIVRKRNQPIHVSKRTLQPRTENHRLSNALTSIPRLMASPACSAKVSDGRTPTPKTRKSASTVVPLVKVTVRPFTRLTVCPK